MNKLILVFLLVCGFVHNSLALELPDSKEAAIEVILQNGKTIWVHGSHMGAFVTKDGKAANPGVYASKDDKLRFKVDHLGHLTHNLFTKFDGPAVVEKPAEIEDELLEIEDDDDENIDEIIG